MLGLLALLLLAGGAVALLAGGGDDSEPASAPATNVRASDWRELPPARQTRQQAPATVQFGVIWLLGGLTGQGRLHRGHAHRRGLRHGHRPVEGRACPCPLPLHHAMAATYRDRLVVMGGWVPEGDVLSAKTTNRVWELQGERWRPLPPMKTPRNAGIAVVVGDKLVVTGGQNQNRLVATTEVFDGREWKQVADIPTTREHLGGATDGRFVYAVGGRKLAADKNLATLERYDPAKDEWEELPGMPKPLGGLGAAFAAGRVVAVGAETSNAVLGTTLLYDVARKKWSSADSLPTARHGLSVAVGRVARSTRWRAPCSRGTRTRRTWPRPSHSSRSEPVPRRPAHGLPGRAPGAPRRRPGRRALPPVLRRRRQPAHLRAGRCPGAADDRPRARAASSSCPGTRASRARTRSSSASARATGRWSTTGCRATARSSTASACVSAAGWPTATCCAWATPASSSAPRWARSSQTIPATAEREVQLSPAQRRVLVALCRPFRDDNEFATPASNQEIADELVVSVEAVKTHMRALFERFGVGDLPRQAKRSQLVRRAFQNGAISVKDL